MKLTGKLNVLVYPVYRAYAYYKLACTGVPAKKSVQIPLCAFQAVIWISLAIYKSLSVSCNSSRFPASIPYRRSLCCHGSKAQGKGFFPYFSVLVIRREYDGTRKRYACYCRARSFHGRPKALQWEVLQYPLPAFYGCLFRQARENRVASLVRRIKSISSQAHN